MFSKRVERTSSVFFHEPFSIAVVRIRTVHRPYMSLWRETRDMGMFVELIQFNSPIRIRSNDKTTSFCEIFVYVVYYLPRSRCVSTTRNQWSLSGNRPCYATDMVRDG